MTETAKLPAEQISVRAYRQILIWPVLLKGASHEGEVEDWVTRFTAHGSLWKKQPMLPKTPAPAADVSQPFGGDPWKLPLDPTYEEIVYFHPFVRDFFYGDGDPRSARHHPLERLVCKQVRYVRAQLIDSKGKKEKEWLLAAPRCELYVFRPEVAILALEVEWKESEASSPVALNLADVLNLQFGLRQVYPPYFIGDQPGNCPLDVALLDEAREVIEIEKNVPFESNYRSGRATFANFTQKGAEPPVAEHWQLLLSPIGPLDRAGTGKPAFQQILDDRIPGMTYLAVDDPRQISLGDRDRLCFCETPGSNAYPYSREFLDGLRKDREYRRFWQENGSDDASEMKEYNTLYLCSGYQFIALGSATNETFYRFIVHHFRQHYFRLGLIVHYHRAALLHFADEMAEAIRMLRGASLNEAPSQESFRKRVDAVLESFLKFRSRAWFQEASNQMQGEEIYEWWSERLNTQSLFEEVDQLSQQLFTTLSVKAQEQIANHSLWIAIIAALIGVGQIVTAILALK